MREDAYSFLPKQMMQHMYCSRKELDRDILYNVRIEKVEKGIMLKSGL